MATKNKSKLLTAAGVISIFVIIILIKISSFYPIWIETHYSNTIYPYISSFFRFLFGWIPFSLGDFVYGAFSVYLLWILFRIIRAIYNRRVVLINYRKLFVKGFYICSVIYIFFNLAWGLNYNRLSISSQLQLKTSKHTVEDLRVITGELITKVNATRLALGHEIKYPSNANIFDGAGDAYKNVAGTFPFLQYAPKSIKTSLYGKMGNFFGFLGYYNPFTGEAQVNTAQPKFLIPYVSTHEIAHQLGYAREGEANFVGYLAAVNSHDTLFKYSVYFDLFNYANRELYFRDSAYARNNLEKLDTLVKKDRAELKKYLRQSDNYVEPIIKMFYDQYLRANQQDKGIKSYNEVIGVLIAYYKKYGRI